MNRLGRVLLVVCLFGFGSCSLAQDSRTWKSANGKFEIDAKLLKIEGDKVVLEKSDGNQITVPLDKLSPVDQGYIEGRRSSSLGGENPFAETNGNSKPANSGAPRELRVDYQDCVETGITKGNWAPTIKEQPSSPIDLKNFSVKPKGDFWEKIAHTCFNVYAKRAVITSHFGKPGKPGSTRMELIDLESGRSLANASGEGKWNALAIHDDGERIVVQKADNEQAMRQLGTVQLKGKKIVPLDLWEPYEKMTQPDKEKVVRFARFINNNRLLTLSQSGRVVIWDFERRKPVRRFNYHGACEPSLSNDRKHLAICGGDIFGIVNLEDDKEEPSVKEAPQMNYWLSSCFSPSCKRFAAATMAKLMVWDVASGDVLFEGKIPGLPTSGKLLFPHEDYVMINGDKLIEIESRIKLWKYNGGVKSMVHGQLFVVHNENSGGRAMKISVPHSQALDILEKAKKQSDIFVLKKGAEVRFDLQGVPRQYQGDVEQSLRENIERMGFVFSPNAKVTFKASISGPETEAVSYHFAGSFVVRKFTSRLSIDYDGQSIWASQSSNVPGAVSGRGKEEIKKQLEKAGRSPNIGFFTGTQLPEFLQKPSGDSQNRGNNYDKQMLGVSNISLNGLK